MPGFTVTRRGLETDGSGAAQHGQLPPSVVSGGSADALGRTQLLQRGDGANPSLRQFVFVDDAPWNAQGDVLKRTDGSISSGSNQLSFVGYNFTQTDVGKTVEALNCMSSSTAPHLYAYIGSVAGGVASLVTTHGGSTPSNAQVTVAGTMTVTFGTDDTTAVTTAATALSNAGGGKLLFSQVKNYWWSKHLPQSNVIYDGQGASFYAMPLPSDGVNPNPAIYQAHGTANPIANVTLRNMVWRGHGQEVHNQYPIQVGTGSNWRIEDCDFFNYAGTGTVGLTDITGIRIINNGFWNCSAVAPPGSGSTGNPLNLSPTAQANNDPLSQVIVSGNFLIGFQSAGIDITPGSVSNPPQTVAFRATIADNVLIGTASSQSTIILELGGSGGQSTYLAQDVLISDNIAIGGGGITVAAPTGNVSFPDPTYEQRVVIADNTINAQVAGGIPITCYASYATITGNTCVGNQGISLRPSQYAVPITGDFVNGNTTINNVSVTAGFNIANGDQLQGLSGIPAGTYLVSGAGTATWVMSQAFTGTTNTGLSFTAIQCARYVSVTGNVCRLTASSGSSTGALQALYVNHLLLTGNQFVYDLGAASSANGALFIDFCGWFHWEGNQLSWAPATGVNFSNCHDIQMHGGEVYNASANAANGTAVFFASGITSNNLMDGVRVIDDRAVVLVGKSVFSTTGANVVVKNCYFVGFTSAALSNLPGFVDARNNYGYNPVGVVTPAVPATGVAVAAQPYDRTFYVSNPGAATVSLAIQNGPTVVMPASVTAICPVRVPANKTLTPTYTSTAPTWVVEGE